ncbi:hypothetical protein V8E53_011310 [Lactarius tabidus]
MPLPNPGYVVLSCHAFLDNIRVIGAHPYLYVFDVAVPSSTPHKQHPLEPNILACSLQFSSRKSLGHIPTGVYHIFAKVVSFISGTHSPSPVLPDEMFSLMGDLIHYHFPFGLTSPGSTMDDHPATVTVSGEQQVCDLPSPSSLYVRVHLLPASSSKFSTTIFPSQHSTVSISGPLITYDEGEIVVAAEDHSTFTPADVFWTVN